MYIRRGQIETPLMLLTIVLVTLFCILQALQEIPIVAFSNKTKQPVWIEYSDGKRVKITKGVSLPVKYERIWIE